MLVLPFLWSLVSHKLLEEIKKEEFRVKGYADDLIIIDGGPFLEIPKGNT